MRAPSSNWCKRSLARGAVLQAAVLLAAVIGMPVAPASALIIANSAVPGSGGADVDSVNTSAPLDDPGWANSSSSRSAVYLGDQWVLTAQHVQTGSIVLPSGEYPVVPGSEVVLTNPSRWLGASVSSLSDIKMYRVGLHPTTGLTPEEMDPSIRQVPIATSTPSRDTEVTAISAGTIRRVHPSQPNGHWRFDSSFNLTGDTSAPYRGYLTSSPQVREKAWGTNTIASPVPVPNLTDNGLNAVLKIPGLNDTMGLVTRFDETYLNDSDFFNPGSTENEFQGAGGDSGGPVFAKNNQGEWELVGVFHGIFLLSNQPSSAPWPIFGQYTGLSDLSQDHYFDQIELLRSSTSYSILGDADLDGIVSGGIVNGVATGDLARIVENYGMAHTAQNAQSWVRGDLNQDGTTDLGDFVLWRDAVGGTVSVQQFALAISAAAVPEPASGVLLLLAVGLLRPGRRA